MDKCAGVVDWSEGIVSTTVRVDASYRYNMTACAWQWDEN